MLSLVGLIRGLDCLMRLSRVHVAVAFRNVSHTLGLSRCGASDFEVK